MTEGRDRTRGVSESFPPLHKDFINPLEPHRAACPTPSLPPTKPSVLPPPSSEGGKAGCAKSIEKSTFLCACGSRGSGKISHKGNLRFGHAARAIYTAFHAVERIAKDFAQRKETIKKGRFVKRPFSVKTHNIKFRLYNKCWGNQVEPAKKKSNQNKKGRAYLVKIR